MSSPIELSVQEFSADVLRDHRGEKFQICDLDYTADYLYTEGEIGHLLLPPRYGFPDAFFRISIANYLKRGYSQNLRNGRVSVGYSPSRERVYASWEAELYLTGFGYIAISYVDATYRPSQLYGASREIDENNEGIFDPAPFFEQKLKTEAAKV